MRMRLAVHEGWTVRVPESFLWADREEIARVCNGMGPKGRGLLVPDTMYGLDLGAAGDVHDWMYAFPENMTRRGCDDIFLENMNSIISQHKGWGWVQWLRRRRALKYYHAVRFGGAKHFNQRRMS